VILAIYLCGIGLIALVSFMIRAWQGENIDECVGTMLFCTILGFFWPIIGSVATLWYAVRATKWMWLRVKGGV
jgi:hypothetical protein